MDVYGRLARFFLDTATLFAYVGRHIGLLAKKELLKVPILGYGMGYVNIMAIDRSNRERALATVRAATERIRGRTPRREGHPRQPSVCDRRPFARKPPPSVPGPENGPGTANVGPLPARTRRGRGGGDG